jgi:septal ring factor EnvC (AmiA/AmiB activator)
VTSDGGGFQLREELLMGESVALKNNEHWQLCDGSGRAIGIVLAPTAVEQMNAERERLANEVSELRKQLEETQRQLGSWQEKSRHHEEQIALLEKDWRSMFRLLPRELQVTEEDIAEIQRDPHSFEEILQMFEQRKPS